MKIINARLHAILDYITVIFLAASPVLFEMNNELSMFTYGLAVVHFLLTISTKYQLGIIKLIPFRIHGIIELVVAVVLAGVALYFNQHRNFLGFYYYLWLALIIAVVFLLTNFNTSSKPAVTY